MGGGGAHRLLRSSSRLHDAVERAAEVAGDARALYDVCALPRHQEGERVNEQTRDRPVERTKHHGTLETRSPTYLETVLGRTFPHRRPFPAVVAMCRFA
jgi:hypothetical protein